MTELGKLASKALIRKGGRHAEHQLASTIGIESSRETISKIREGHRGKSKTVHLAMDTAGIRPPGVQ